MKLSELFDNIILCAQEAKTLYELSAEVESFARLDEVIKTIGVLRDFLTPLKKRTSLISILTPIFSLSI